VSGTPGFPAGRGRLQAGGMSLDERVQRLEELRAKLEACESLEEAVDLLAEFDAAAKDLIEAIDEAKREADAQP
jgi:hypothetical protein